MKIRLCTILLLVSTFVSAAAHAGDRTFHHHRGRYTRHTYHVDSSRLVVNSHIALIYDERTNLPLYTKNVDVVVPIASITKLMTAMVIIDAKLPMDEPVVVGNGDTHLIQSRSRLKVGTVLTRGELLTLALMSSENRAALALAKSYPGGEGAFIVAMNATAHQLGMTHTHFFDPTGLDNDDVSTAEDLVKMVSAAQHYRLIHQYTTTSSRTVDGVGGRDLRYHNTDPLVSDTSWDIGISKTGFIRKAGRCLVMQATINDHPVIIILLHSRGKRTRFTDATRVRRWMERIVAPPPPVVYVMRPHQSTFMSSMYLTHVSPFSNVNRPFVCITEIQ